MEAGAWLEEMMRRRSCGPWGYRYATEIGRAQIGYGFENLRLNRVLAQASPHNHASIAALTKIGMVVHSAVRSEDRGERLVYAVCQPVRG